MFYFIRKQEGSARFKSNGRVRNLSLKVDQSVARNKLELTLTRLEFSINRYEIYEEDAVHDFTEKCVLHAFVITRRYGRTNRRNRSLEEATFIGCV